MNRQKKPAHRGKNKLPKNCNYQTNRFYRVWIFMKYVFFTGEVAYGASQRIIGATERLSDRCRKSKVFFWKSIYHDRCDIYKKCQKKLFIFCINFSSVSQFISVAPVPPFNVVHVNVRFQRGNAVLQDNIEWGYGGASENKIYLMGSGEFIFPSTGLRGGDLTT